MGKLKLIVVWPTMHAYCFYIQLRQLQIGKTDYSQVDDVEIRGGFFKMFPDTWSDSNWKINATVRPALVSTIVNVCTARS